MKQGRSAVDMKSLGCSADRELRAYQFQAPLLGTVV